MADTVKAETTLRIENMFVDGDTRAIVLKNPKATIQSSEITELNAFMQANNVLIGDKAQGTFGRIKSATTVNKQTIQLDLN